MSDFDPNRLDLALRLADAITRMTARYGEAVADYAYATSHRTHADERARLTRAYTRRYRAVQRLTRALRDLAVGGVR